MASVKKADKSKRAKAKTARALKSHHSAAKASKPSASRARPARAAATRASKGTARATTKARASAKSTASTRTKSAAAKLRAAQARLKKQAAAAKAARPAAKSTASKSAAAKTAAARPKAKPATQTLAAAKLKPSTSASRGKSRAGRDARVEPKVVKTEVAARQTAAPRTELQTHNKPIDSERRAKAAAVLALRSLRKPAPALNRPEEASKTSVTQKIAKKTPEVAAASVAKAPVTPVVATPAKPPMPVEAKPMMAPMAEKPKVAKPAAPVKHGFKPLEFVVYPAHGVGQILAIEEQEVAGFKLELFVISFSKDKMILKVPTPKSIAVGMRKLASAELIKQALTTLTGRARIKRTMWSRRAQEYEAKINSGDLVAIAEVVRDLYRSEAQPEQSYSERQLYEAALDRVAREIAAVQKLTDTESLKLIDTQLQKSPRRGKADEADAEADTAGDGGIEEAA